MIMISCQVISCDVNFVGFHCLIMTTTPATKKKLLLILLLTSFYIYNDDDNVEYDHHVWTVLMGAERGRSVERSANFIMCCQHKVKKI